LRTAKERLLENLSFAAPDVDGKKITINAAFVRERLADIVKDRDSSRYIL